MGDVKNVKATCTKCGKILRVVTTYRTASDFLDKFVCPECKWKAIYGAPYGKVRRR